MQAFLEPDGHKAGPGDQQEVDVRKDAEGGTLEAKMHTLCAQWSGLGGGGGGRRRFDSSRLKLQRPKSVAFFSDVYLLICPFFLSRRLSC